MSNEAWNKITQTHDLFKKIIAPLKQHLGVSFGYMIVFKDGSYYQIIEDLECLKKWVTNVKNSSIFCARNVTNYFDGEYNFTLWPNEPDSPAMEIYHEHGIWNGITVSKANEHCTELYWFNREKTEIDWHRFFIRNKQLLLKFIIYFDIQKEALSPTKNYIHQGLFKFGNGFDVNLQKSEYVRGESQSINKFIISLDLLTHHSSLTKSSQIKIKLSSREIEVLSIICQGYTTKMAALKMSISSRTVEHYIERIKEKTGLHFKSDLIKFYKG